MNIVLRIGPSQILRTLARAEVPRCLLFSRSISSGMGECLKFCQDSCIYPLFPWRLAKFVRRSCACQVIPGSKRRLIFIGHSRPDDPVPYPICLVGITQLMWCSCGIPSPGLSSPDIAKGQRRLFIECCPVYHGSWFYCNNRSTS
jgi:hypothetical protein